MNGVFCRGCGALIHPQAPICPSCGFPQHIPARHNKITAALFAFFLGSFGVHKFYLGKVGWGVMYLLLCWTGLPMMASVVDAIVYLTMSDEAFTRRYG